MVAKKKSTTEKEEKKGRVKVGKLKLSKETIKDLTGREGRQVKGGNRIRTGGANCSYDATQDGATCGN